tara:strand:+ start:60 stop:215 length:156 start_codon:yes stop_codon:yes gene_type:complete
MVEFIEAILQMIGIMTLVYLFTIWGLSGGFKIFFTFRKKRKSDVNSGAKFG